MMSPVAVSIVEGCGEHQSLIEVEILKVLLLEYRAEQAPAAIGVAESEL